MRAVLRADERAGRRGMPTVPRRVGRASPPPVRQCRKPPSRGRDIHSWNVSRSCSATSAQQRVVLEPAPEPGCADHLLGLLSDRSMREALAASAKRPRPSGARVGNEWAPGSRPGSPPARRPDRWKPPRARRENHSRGTLRRRRTGSRRRIGRPMRREASAFTHSVAPRSPRHPSPSVHIPMRPCTRAPRGVVAQLSRRRKPGMAGRDEHVRHLDCRHREELPFDPDPVDAYAARSSQPLRSRSSATTRGTPEPSGCTGWPRSRAAASFVGRSASRTASRGTTLAEQCPSLSIACASAGSLGACRAQTAAGSVDSSKTTISSG